MISEELDIIRLRYDIKKKKVKKPKKPKNKGGKKKKFPGDASNKGRDPKDILAGVILFVKSFIYFKNCLI